MRRWGLALGVWLCAVGAGCGDSAEQGGAPSGGAGAGPAGGGSPAGGEAPSGGNTGSGGGTTVPGGSCTPVNAEPPAPGTFEPLLDDEALSELFSALDAFSQTRTHGDDAQSDAEILYDFVKTAPHVIEAGVGQDCAVWMALSDGTPVTIFKGRDDFEEGDADPTAALEGPEPSPPSPAVPNDLPPPIGAGPQYKLPKSGKALIGQASNLSPFALARIQTSLGDRGYQVERDDSLQVSDLLTKVSGLGVFHFSTHGLSCWDPESGAVGYCLGTDSQFIPNFQSSVWGCQETAAECQLIGQQRAAGRIGLTVQEEGGIKKGYYAVNHAFASAHWTFADNAFVYLDACGSLGETTVTNPQFLYAPWFRSVLMQKKVGAIMGWTGLVEKDFSAQTAALAFDKILGSNKLEVPTPKQRPFSVGEIYQWLESKGKVTDPSNLTTLLKVQAATDTDVILAPSVRNLVVGANASSLISQEQPGADTELSVFGEFGSDPVTVKIAGSVLQDGAQTDSALVRNLPGPTSDGLVSVEVTIGSETIKSNAVPLTSWNGPCRFKTVHSATFGPPGIFNELDCSDLHFRGDVHSFRVRPGEEAKPGFALDGTSVQTEIPFRSSVADTACQGKTGGTSSNVYELVYEASTIPLNWLPNQMSSIPGPPTSYYIVTAKIDASNPNALKAAVWPADRLHADADFIYPDPVGPVHMADFGTTVTGIGYIDHFIPLGTDFSFQQGQVAVPIGTGDQGEMECTMTASQIPDEDTEG
ncbi:MAG: hypothetical protein JNK04_15850 [Myxococcales bacterium]|nr:hypothetical protein [Myxococcales bacterium]